MPPISSSKFPTDYECKMFVGETHKENEKNAGLSMFCGTKSLETPSFNKYPWSSAFFVAYSLCSLVLLGSINPSSPCTWLWDTIGSDCTSALNWFWDTRKPTTVGTLEGISSLGQWVKDLGRPQAVVSMVDFDLQVYAYKWFYNVQDVHSNIKFSRRFTNVRPASHSTFSLWHSVVPTLLWVRRATWSSLRTIAGGDRPHHPHHCSGFKLHACMHACMLPSDWTIAPIARTCPSKHHQTPLTMFP